MESPQVCHPPRLLQGGPVSAAGRAAQAWLAGRRRGSRGQVFRQWASTRPQVFNLRLPALCAAPLGAARAPSPDVRSRRKPNRVSDGDRVRRAARGCPCPVAGRSPRPSRPRLSACPLRFGILPALAPIARLPGHGQPRAPVVKWPQVFNLRNPSPGWLLCRLKTCTHCPVRRTLASPRRASAGNGQEGIAGVFPASPDGEPPGAANLGFAPPGIRPHRPGMAVRPCVQPTETSCSPTRCGGSA